MTHTQSGADVPSWGSSQSTGGEWPRYAHVFVLLMVEEVVPGESETVNFSQQAVYREKLTSN